MTSEEKTSLKFDDEIVASSRWHHTIVRFWYYCSRSIQRAVGRGPYPEIVRQCLSGASRKQPSSPKADDMVAVLLDFPYESNVTNWSRRGKDLNTDEEQIVVDIENWVRDASREIWRSNLREIGRKIENGYIFAEDERQILLSFADSIRAAFTPEDWEPADIPRSKELDVPAKSAQDFITSGSFLSKLMSRERLPRYFRFLVRSVAKRSFEILRYENPQAIEEYGEFFESSYFPVKKEGWLIFRDEYKKMFGRKLDY